jgi:hypothetical protein
MVGHCRLVIIRWQDSRQPCGQWRYLATLPESKPVEVASVGWLVKDTADVKVIAQNIGDLAFPENAQASGIMTIPTRCVISIESLSEDGPTFSVGPDPVDSAGRRSSAGFPAGDLAVTGTAPAPTPREFEPHPA